MFYLIASLWLVLSLSAILGFIIGAWIWRDPSRDAQEAEFGYAAVSAPIIPPAPPAIEPEPVAELPTIEEPVADAEPEPALEPEPEPVADSEPEAVAEPTPAPSPFLTEPNGEPDNLTLIKGVGPKLGDMLHGLGVFHFSQIADWDADQVAEVDSQLGTFKGRVSRDRWVDQARMLANRDIAAFEREFGKMNGRL
ncbi:hypothetical protein [Parasphingopyxis lamellibrachiae]|uniref:Putative flap endonuclease-1-like 5' DNA nuclease n=1 Tax=Parasphingopyxis lamellibrachiae TaxID=680125 RepID=A0A3D9FHH3_9SPHN|nr:hypothetical protein [Parasphingopyxis lamellibrachiae]RED17240.1 putative flap endonuclease-1-like 5' DNA nuclease [Parasphingopyxis lamellibrachiae]